MFLIIFFSSGNVYFTQLHFLLILFLYVYFHSIGARAAVKVSLMSSVFCYCSLFFHLPFHYNASLRSTHIQSHLSEHYISKILHFAQVRFHCPFIYIYILVGRGINKCQFVVFNFSYCSFLFSSSLSLQ